MLRGRKQIELREVGREPEEEAPVLRLGVREGEEGAKPAAPAAPVRLGVAAGAGTAGRLVVPPRVVGEVRTFEPGFEELVAKEAEGAAAAKGEWEEVAAQPMAIPWGWLALAGLLAAGGVLWSLGKLKESEKVLAAVEESARERVAQLEKEEREARQMVEAIEAAIRRYFSASRIEDLAPLVRQPQRVMPLIEAHHRGKPYEANPVEELLSLHPLTVGRSADFWIASVRLRRGISNQVVVEAPTGGGNPLIDWELLVCHQPMPWDEFVRTRPRGRGMPFRVEVVPDTLYSHEFSDSSRWTCLRLSARDSEEYLFGYVPRGSAEEEEILGLVAASAGSEGRLILRLSIPEGLRAPRAAIVERVMSRSWVYQEPPANE